MMKSVDVLPITQPIGTFYMGVMMAEDLDDIVLVRTRRQSEDAVQRDETMSRISEISEYCSDQDATFPTPIIVSIFPTALAYIKDNRLFYNDSEVVGEVIDGQHRLKGIMKSDYAHKFQLPVIFMMNMTNEENAYVFSVINSKQTKVNASLIYDLYGMAQGRSPQKTVHLLARSMNSNEDSPFYNRLKMLGTKEEGQDYATLSQGTFASYIIKLLSKNPVEDNKRLRRGEEITEDEGMPMRKFFILNRDDIIYRILFNCFDALKNVFYEEWNNPHDNILWKTTGFGAIVTSLPVLIEKGIKNNNLTEKYFINCFNAFKNKLSEENKQLNSEHFGSGKQAQNRLSDIIVTAVNNTEDVKLFI